MPKTDIYTYHKEEEFPSHTRAKVAILVVFGAFFAFGSYSLWQLWSVYGAQIMSFIQSSGLPDFLTANVLNIGAVVVGFVVFSLLLAIGAAALARRLGAGLIYLGALFMNIMTWGIVIVLLISGMPISMLLSAWPIMIPGVFTLFLTLLLFTVFKSRVQRAGKIITLTGQVCLDEKGVFVPPLLTMIFTLVAGLMYGAIIFQFTPLDVILGTEPWTVDSALPVGLGMLLYLFTTIFFYNFAYGTSSAMVYIYMRGRDPSLNDGVRGALGVVGGIAILSVLSVIVIIIRIILERLGRQAGGAGGAALGRAAGGILGWVWMLINYFTIPAMVAEELGAKAGIKRSASLVKNNFVDVLIKETAVRWGFGVLAAIFFIAFAAGGAVIGWIVSAGDIITTLIFALVFIVFAGIPSTLVLRTFDIVYVTLLYVFIRRKEGEIRGKTAIPSSMRKELDSAYTRAKKSG